MIAAQEVVFPAGTVRLHDVDGDGTGELQITNPSGGLLAGDRMDTELVLRAGVRLSVVTQGANRVCGPAESPVAGVPAAGGAGSAGTLRASPVTSLHTAMTLEGDALLEWAPHHLVPYARSSVHQRTAVEVASAAGLLAWETLSSGRSGRGERFAWERLDVRMRITREGRPLLHDGAVLGPAGEPFDGADLVSTVVVVLPREPPAAGAPATRRREAGGQAAGGPQAGARTAGAPPHDRRAEALADELHAALSGAHGVLASASAVDAELVVARVVARDAVALYRALEAVRGIARAALGLPSPQRPVT